MLNQNLSDSGIHNRFCLKTSRSSAANEGRLAGALRVTDFIADGRGAAYTSHYRFINDGDPNAAFGTPDGKPATMRFVHSE
jgi:hypothetical protein